MDDLIDQVGIDAKHSTQDVIEPIIISKQRWGERVGLLGGVDVDFITRRTPEQVRAYTRRILETCTSGGGFALGVGNWVADSIPFENFLALSNWLHSETDQTHNIALARLFRLLFKFMTQELKLDKNQTEAYLLKDFVDSGIKGHPKFMVAEHQHENAIKVDKRRSESRQKRHQIK